MIKKFLMVIVLIGCKSSPKAYLYKNTDMADYPISNYFPWSNQSGYEIDSIKLKGKRKLYKIILNSKLKKEYFSKSYLPVNPDYALIINFKGKKDTLYINFDYKSAYLSNSEFMIDSLDDNFHKILYKKNKEFMKRDFKYYNNKFNHK